MISRALLGALLRRRELRRQMASRIKEAVATRLADQRGVADAAAAKAAESLELSEGFAALGSCCTMRDDSSNQL